MSLTEGEGLGPGPGDVQPSKPPCVGGAAEVVDPAPRRLAVLP